MRFVPAFASLRPLLFPLAISAVVTGCGRSAGGSGGDKATEALSTAQEARATATDAKGAVDDLDGRVGVLETTVTDHGTRLLGAEADIATLQDGQASLGGRVDALELGGGGGGVASTIAVDDPAAAGFVAADGVATLEDGFAVLNGKVATQTGRIDTLENDFVTNLTDTVVQTVNTEIGNGNINATVDVSFTPPVVDVDPRADNGDDVPEYSASATLEDAIKALRFANQVKFVAEATDTRLGALYDGTTRSYVQEAIRVLDKDLYDVIAGNVSPTLDTTNLPQDGTYDTVQLAVEDLYGRVSDVQAGADPALTAYIQQQIAVNAQPYILGATATPTSGYVTEAVTGYAGLRGATARCQADFAAEPTAHLCTVDEAQRALSLGRYAGALVDVTAWAMGPALADSCDGLLSGDVGDNGTTLVVDLGYVGTSGTGDVAYAGTATCDATYPVLCCR